MFKIKFANFILFVNLQKSKSYVVQHIHYSTMLILFLFLLYPFASSLRLSHMATKITQYAVSPHQTSCYTQGLFFLNNTHMFESCGLYGQSYFHVMEYSNTPQGFTIRETFKSQIPIDKKIFLEGATIFQSKIYMLTWKQHIVFNLNPDTFQIENNLIWQRQGWGLTQNKTHLFVSDGSSQIFICDQNMTILDQKTITNSSNHSIANLNELQYADGYLWINVYETNKILKVDIETGKVVKQFTGKALQQNQPQRKQDEVLNGIAYNKDLDFYLLTGKDWIYFYQVVLS